MLSLLPSPAKNQCGEKKLWEKKGQNKNATGRQISNLLVLLYHPCRSTTESQIAINTINYHCSREQNITYLSSTKSWIWVKLNLICLLPKENNRKSFPGAIINLLTEQQRQRKQQGCMVKTIVNSGKLN